MMLVTHATPAYEVSDGPNVGFDITLLPADVVCIRVLERKRTPRSQSVSIESVWCDRANVGWLAGALGAVGRQPWQVTVAFRAGADAFELFDSIAGFYVHGHMHAKSSLRIVRSDAAARSGSYQIHFSNETARMLSEALQALAESDAALRAGGVPLGLTLLEAVQRRMGFVSIDAFVGKWIDVARDDLYDYCTYNGLAVEVVEGVIRIFERVCTENSETVELFAFGRESLSWLLGALDRALVSPLLAEPQVYDNRLDALEVRCQTLDPKQVHVFVQNRPRPIAPYYLGDGFGDQYMLSVSLPFVRLLVAALHGLTVGGGDSGARGAGSRWKWPWGRDKQ